MCKGKSVDLSKLYNLNVLLCPEMVIFSYFFPLSSPFLYSYVILHFKFKIWYKHLHALSAF